MKATDEQIIEAWKRTQNYAQVERDLGISRQNARVHILRLRAAGHDLPPARRAGYTLTSERAREIGGIRRSKDANAKGD